MLFHVANAAAIIAGLNAAGILPAISLAAWLVESWYAARVAIDQSLFRTLAANPPEGAEWMDSLLLDWKFVKARKSRSIADRSRGAVRLWRMQAAALMVQLAALAAAEILRAVHG